MKSSRHKQVKTAAAQYKYKHYERQEGNMTPTKTKTQKTHIHTHAEGAETCFCEAIWKNTFITHTSRDRVNIHTHNYKNRRIGKHTKTPRSSHPAIHTTHLTTDNPLDTGTHTLTHTLSIIMFITVNQPTDTHHSNSICLFRFVLL